MVWMEVSGNLSDSCADDAQKHYSGISNVKTPFEFSLHWDIAEAVC